MREREEREREREREIGREKEENDGRQGIWKGKRKGRKNKKVKENKEKYLPSLSLNTSDLLSSVFLAHYHYV